VKALWVWLPSGVRDALRGLIYAIAITLVILLLSEPGAGFRYLSV